MHTVMLPPSVHEVPSASSSNDLARIVPVRTLHFGQLNNSRGALEGS